MTKKGFTIVELLIVIVVIAILAAISIVAYNGIQARAENTKTISAVSAWAKALQMYKIDNGSYPSINSCLGAPSTYSNAHSGRCYGTSTNGTWIVNNGFLSTMNPYIGSSYPEPSDKDINANDSGSQYRGAMYYLNSGAHEIRVSLIGIGSINECPAISGLDTVSSTLSTTESRICRYPLPQ